jgi:hypothetical protein
MTHCNSEPALPCHKEVIASLAQLRTNAVLALRTSGAHAVAKEDIDRLDAIVAGVFGNIPPELDYAPLVSIPQPNGVILKALTERLPATDAEAAHAFLVDLHQRTRDWFYG